MASNTAYGPLIGHFDLNSEAANGFDALGGATYLNTGYLTWAGITAGMAQSFFSFTAGGDNWANFLSPDRKGFNEPDSVGLHRVVRRRLHGDDLGGKPRSGRAAPAGASSMTGAIGSQPRQHHLWRPALA